MTATTSKLRTRSGRALHPVGIGTWGYGEYPLYSPGTAAEVEAIEYAVSLGQNHIDTAEIYAHGGAEHVVGEAIKSASREDLFLASKLWKDHVAKGQVRLAVEAMLKRLGTDYLDMLYIHAPWFDAPWQEAIPQACALIDEGLVHYLGVSNFNAGRFREAQSLASYPIAANQMHYSYCHRQEVTHELLSLCNHEGATIVAYLPLEHGACLQDVGLQYLARRLQASPAQISLAWLLAQGVLPIPKALSRAHIEQNSAGVATLASVIKIILR